MVQVLEIRNNCALPISQADQKRQIKTEDKTEERKQIIQQVAKLQMQPSGSLKNLKELDPSRDNIDLGHVKLNVSNLKTFREKSSKIKKEEHKFKRRFPIIQIRGKIKSTLSVKHSNDSNIPKFLLQQKQMTKNLEFQSPSANRIRSIIKGFNSTKQGGRNDSREGGKRHHITTANPLISSAIQTPLAAKQKPIQIGVQSLDQVDFQ